MSHFYRLHNASDYGDEGDFVWKSSYRPSGEKGSLPVEWRRMREDIPLVPPWPHCRMYRIPPFPAGYEQRFHQFLLKPGKKVPDIFCTSERLLVSERAKAVLETCDDFEHEYIETEVQDTERRRINEQPYYLLSVRRFLEIEPVGGKVENWQKMFPPDAYEKDFLPTLQASKELMDRVAQLPLWRHKGNYSVVYLSEVVLSDLRQAGITGLTPYSSLLGAGGESITRFDA